MENKYSHIFIFNTIITIKNAYIFIVNKNIYIVSILIIYLITLNNILLVYSDEIDILNMFLIIILFNTSKFICVYIFILIISNI